MCKRCNKWRAFRTNLEVISGAFVVEPLKSITKNQSQGNKMKVKSKRAFITKKYTFLDENEKDINVEFRFYALSAKQQEEIGSAKEKANEVIKAIMSDNLKGDEPYKTALLDYLYEEGNIYEEFVTLNEELGKQKKRS